MIYSIHDNGDLLAADISGPSGNINVINYMPITVQVITRADTFFMIGNNANTELNKYQGELTLFCTGSASYSVYKNNYIAANRLGTASPNTAFNITKNWLGSIFVDDTGTSSAPNEIFKLYIFKGMLSTQECISRAGFRGEDHVIIDGKPRLPLRYQELAYLEATGSQWVDTGVKPTANIRAVIGGNWSDNAARSETLLGARDAVNTNHFMLDKSASGYLGMYVGNTGLANKTIDFTEYHEYKYEYRQLFIDNSAFYTLPNPTFTTPLANIVLFGVNNNGTIQKQSRGIIKFVTLYAAQTLTAELVPCYDKETDVNGYYNLVNNVFNMEHGRLLRGPEVNKIYQRRIQA